jgi:hypothetical protein
MAAVTGSTGLISFGASPGPADLLLAGGNALLAFRWTLNITGELHDVTPFNVANADLLHRVKIRGHHSASGTAEGYHDGATVHDLLPYQSSTATSAFVLTTNDPGTTAQIYSFSGFITGFNITVDAFGPNRWTATFESSGALSATAGAA